MPQWELVEWAEAIAGEARMEVDGIDQAMKTVLRAQKGRHR